MQLAELQVYQLARDIAERIWDIVIKWDYFAKDTMGKQLVKAADAVAANLSEGHGRFFYNREQTVLLLQPGIVIRNQNLDY